MSEGPIRTTVRGGRDQFTWSSIKDSKHSHNYLGHSLKAATGRWQNGKDLEWWNKHKEDTELTGIKEAEEDALRQAMGLDPLDRSVNAQDGKESPRSQKRRRSRSRDRSRDRDRRSRDRFRDRSRESRRHRSRSRDRKRRSNDDTDLKSRSSHRRRSRSRDRSYRIRRSGSRDKERSRDRSRSRERKRRSRHHSRDRSRDRRHSRDHSPRHHPPKSRRTQNKHSSRKESPDV